MMMNATIMLLVVAKIMILIIIQIIKMMITMTMKPLRAASHAGRTHPGRGPPLSRSNTWYGLSSFLKEEMSSRPWHPPDFTLTKTRSGCTPSEIMWGRMFGSNITGERVGVSLGKSVTSFWDSDVIGKSDSVTHQNWLNRFIIDIESPSLFRKMPTVHFLEIKRRL